MKLTILRRLLIITTVWHLSLYQSAGQDISKVMDQLQYEQDTVLTIYKWVAENIAYDVYLMNQRQQKNYKNEIRGSVEEYEQQLLKKTISTKKAVCEGYSLLFDKLLQAHGYRSYIITGYTKDARGKLNRRIGHNWNIAYVDGQWKLYDPTWAAGYVVDGREFVKLYSDKWYAVDPAVMLQNHMPFDPVWQLQDQAISYMTFEVGKTVPTLAIDYNTILENMEGKDRGTLQEEALARAERLGDGMRLVTKWKKRLSGNSTVNDLNNTSSQMSVAVDLYNEYIEAKNRNFADEVWSPAYAVEHLLDIKSIANDALEVFSTAKLKGREANSKIKSAKKNTKALLAEVERELGEMQNRL